MAELEVSDVFEGGSNMEKLLDKLDQAFPLYNPAPDDSLAKIMYLAGQRSVVDFIRSTIEE